MRKFYVKSVDNIVSIKNCLMLFKNDTKGIMAIISAIIIFPVFILSMGTMFDYGQYTIQQRKIQTSLDAALLSSAQYVGRKSEIEITEHIQKAFAINYTSTGAINVPIISVKMSSGLITASGSTFLKTSILGLIGVKQIPLPVFASLSYHTSKVDVALVLDTSGSMRGARLAQLQQAASLFVETLFGDTKTYHPSLQVGIVPFAQAVQLNPQHIKHKSWLDTDALSPIHSENFATKINRFDLYNKLDIAWQGCLESRPYPYDVHDYDPKKSEMTVEEQKVNTPRNARFFVPWFEPDQPEEIKHNINYVIDNKTDLLDYNLQVPENLAHLDLEPGWPEDWYKYQGNARKYTKANRTTNIRSIRGGPEFWCAPKEGTKMLADLNSSSGNILTRISELEASGMTNILIGFTWGWRMLSPGEPLTQSKDNSRKVLILLTDGDNKIAGIDNQHFFNRYQPYIYDSYGLAYLNRLRIDADLQLKDFQAYIKTGQINDYVDYSHVQAADARFAEINKRLLQACIHAKKTGIEVYTIAFGPDSNTTTQELLKNCASSSEHFYRAQSSDLNGVFGQVANSISRLYLSQ